MNVEPTTPRWLRLRLSTLMFLQYAPAGAVIPLFSLRLQELGFTPVETSWVCATQSLGTLASPLLAGQAADRWWPAERVLAACAILAGGTLWLLASLTTPLLVFAAAVVFWMLLAPAMSLGVTLTFSHLRNPALDFSGVRLWGTAGWVAISWIASWWLTSAEQLTNWLGFGTHRISLADVFRIGGLFAIALGLYALTLPHTPPQKTVSGRVAPLAAIRSMRSRALIVYLICVVGICVTLPFNSQVTPLFLKARGISGEAIPALLTLAQIAELLCMIILPMLLTRLGIKGTLTVGIAACAAALAIITIGHPLWLVIGSLTLYGICICCFFVAGQVFINSKARPDVRASAQSLFNFTIGTGMLIGHISVGWVREWAEQAFQPTFLVAAALAGVLCVVFVAGFPGDEV